MESFTKNHSALLLTKEWLVKLDNSNSTPYLLKFGYSDETSTCCIMITDTKTVWSEVLTYKQLLRRWHECNPRRPLLSSDNSSSEVLKLLSLIHTIGGISDASFDITRSLDADLSFELDWDDIKWRWNSYLLGPKSSADTISKHLIMPLICMAHVSFYSADPVSELADNDLENVIDKIGRTARRSMDIHVKQTLTKPRITTSIQRISSLLSFSLALPHIVSESDTPDLEQALTNLQAPINASTSPATGVSVTQHRYEHPKSPTILKDTSSIRIQEVLKQAPSDPKPGDSETESDENMEDISVMTNLQAQPKVLASSSGTRSAAPLRPRNTQSTIRASNITLQVHSESSDDEQDAPPLKKSRGQVSKVADSDSDSDADQTGGNSNSQLSQEARSRGVANRGSGRAPTRSVRQPIRRGTKRF